MFLVNGRFLVLFSDYKLFLHSSFTVSAWRIPSGFPDTSCRPSFDTLKSIDKSERTPISLGIRACIVRAQFCLRLHSCVQRMVKTKVNLTIHYPASHWVAPFAKGTVGL